MPTIGQINLGNRVPDTHQPNDGVGYVNAKENTQSLVRLSSTDSRLIELSMIKRDNRGNLESVVRSVGWNECSPSVKKDLKKEIARGVYQRNVIYHGTNRSSKQSIQHDGFDVRLKSNGAMHARAPLLPQGPNLESAVATARQHNYFVSGSLKEMSKRYAKMTDDLQPALVRVMGAHHDIAFEPDPDASLPNMPQYSKIRRTSSAIPPEYVLQSKRSLAGGDGSVFQREMARKGVHVSTDEAGRLLREVQSDSEDDFK
jgi:hypothetical protein